MGKNYRSGGASPQKGFDCSGLIWWVYNKNGVKVPRITVDQARIGQSVPREQVRPGDIVVFRTSASPRGLHTGIYAGGQLLYPQPAQGRKSAYGEYGHPLLAQPGLSQCGASCAEPLRHVLLPSRITASRARRTVPSRPCKKRRKKPCLVGISPHNVAIPRANPQAIQAAQLHPTAGPVVRFFCKLKTATRPSNHNKDRAGGKPACSPVLQSCPFRPCGRFHAAPEKRQKIKDGSDRAPVQQTARHICRPGRKPSKNAECCAKKAGSLPRQRILLTFFLNAAA